MHILINSGTCNCLNMGDVAMLQIAVRRLERLFPSATLQVITDTPDTLVRYCPGSQPVSARAFNTWFADDIFLPRGQRFVPRALLSRLANAKMHLRRRWPRLLRQYLMAARPEGLRSAELSPFFEALYSADCVVLCGQGFLTDHVGREALTKLQLLATAKARGIPCAMLGQGFGPLTNGAILQLTRKVLPHVDVLSLREGLAGIPLCRSVQLGHTKPLVTGDEAIELAYDRKRPAVTTGVGINVRLSPSSGFPQNVLPSLASALKRFAQGRQIQYVPLPIARDHGLRDVNAIRDLLHLAGEDSDGGVDLDTPEAVIKETSKCRIVLTGAYHAAVFALSQGIPAICFAHSDYFRIKFEGLAGQFGTGCVVISLSNPHALQTLEESLVWAWNAASSLEPELRRAASLQVLKSYRAYNRLGRVLHCRVPGSDIRLLAPPSRDRRLVPSMGDK